VLCQCTQPRVPSSTSATLRQGRPLAGPTDELGLVEPNDRLGNGIVHATPGEEVRHLTLDPTRDYQPTGQPLVPPPQKTTTARNPNEGSGRPGSIERSHGAGDGDRTRIISLGTAPAIPLTGGDLRAEVARSALTGQVGTRRVALKRPGSGDCSIS
jgi:hypothetical protein